MRIHVLGGGNAQLNMIRMLKAAGHTVVVSDYLPDAPGKQIADYSSMVSTFDAEGVIRISRWYDVDGILTLGTDQPVLTAAIASEELGLPFPITVEQARAVTHKRVMKTRLDEAGVRTVPWRCVKKGFSEDELQGIEPPYVMKPLDSQGQRGIFKIDTIDEIRDHIDETLSFSRDDQVLIEQYYPHEELTVSGWIHEGRLSVLTITDRITQDTPPSIGVCFAHRCPSKHIADKEEITKISESVVEALGLREGPIYIQLLKGEAGYLVNEIAARVGGAFEEYVIPAVTGVPVNELLMEVSVGNRPDPENWLKEKGLSAYVLFFFAESGTVARTGDIDHLLEMPEVLTAAYLVSPGDELSAVTNATGRAGYAVLSASAERIESVREEVMRRFSVQDRNGRDMIMPIKEFE